MYVYTFRKFVYGLHQNFYLMPDEGSKSIFETFAKNSLEKKIIINGFGFTTIVKNIYT